MFEFMSGVLCLGEDMELPQEEGVFTKAKKCSPRQRGSPRRRYVRLSEPGDRIVEVSGQPRRGFAHLGEPLHQGEGRLCLGKPMIVLRPVFMACLGLVSWSGL